MQDYTKLEVYTKSYNLVLLIYKITKNFPKEELYSITSQIRRAGTSISLNIAEGSGKSSEKDKSRFLQISIGSCNECSVLISLAKDLGFINIKDFNELSDKVDQIRRMLINLNKRVLENYK